MARAPAAWVYSPARAPKQKVPETQKKEIEAAAAQLVRKVLKPKHLKPAPKRANYNYLVDIHTKWHGRYFYFCGTYRNPRPHAIAPTFELKFARLEYFGEQNFQLSYMRHTEQWFALYSGLTLDECFAAIRDQPHFFVFHDSLGGLW